MKRIVDKASYRTCLAIEKEKIGGTMLPINLREKDILFHYIRWLRRTELYLNTGNKLLYVFSKIQLTRMQNRYFIHIPPNTCGMGLSIAHVGPIIINDGSEIGDNLRIHVGVTIGANGGEPPKLGSDVYIGAGAKVIGDIWIADKCKIGANAVVNKSCNVPGAVLVGIPAKVHI